MLRCVVQLLLASHTEAVAAMLTTGPDQLISSKLLLTAIRTKVSPPKCVVCP
ncbi:hypothetical protein J6590_092255 [Homalodisca vitripennis]|nr:hypothetical protein J6590_092255 [Homalodisca vitripennis]